MQPNYTPIKTHNFLDRASIEAYLVGVEYIIMAAPAVDDTAKLPIHFSLFLNTSDAIPEPIQKAILDKFCTQYNITEYSDVHSELGSVAFAETNHETHMPMHLLKAEDRKALPHVTMHIIDFLGDSPDFKEPKEGATGWSYAYSDD